MRTRSPNSVFANRFKCIYNPGEMKSFGLKVPILGHRGGQYRGTVTRYFFSTVIGNVGTFSKKYRFWYRRYFFSAFTVVTE